jgi:hypothetical protein
VSAGQLECGQRRLCAQQFLSYPFQQSFGPCAKRLVGRKIGPNRAAVARIRAAASFGFRQPFGDFHGYRGFQFREPLVDLSQKREMRVTPVGANEKAGNPSERLPRDARAEILEVKNPWKDSMVRSLPIQRRRVMPISIW